MPDIDKLKKELQDLEKKRNMTESEERGADHIREEIIRLEEMRRRRATLRLDLSDGRGNSNGNQN